MNEGSELISDLINVCKNRQAFYQLLSRILEKEVNEELLAAFREKMNLFSQSPEGLDDKKMIKGLGLVQSYLESTSKKPADKVCLELAVEYAGLFLGVWGKPPHPSESIYGRSAGQVMQGERDEVLNLYRSVGLDRSKDFREPEDHIAIELQFMSLLSDKTIEAARSGNISEIKRLIDLQESFLKQHLGKWIGFLTHDVIEEARLDFYKGVCLLAEGFVEEDRMVLEELKRELS